MESDSSRFVVIVAVLAVLAAGAFMAWRYRADIQGWFGGAQAVDAAVLDAGVIPDAEVVAEKSLAEGDEELRKVAPKAWQEPLPGGWLSSADLIQRIAAAVHLIAAGSSPKPVLSFIEIEGQFKVTEQVKAVPGKAIKGAKGKKRPKDVNERDFIAPESYARYDKVVRVFTSADVQYAGRAYAQLRPYFDSAYAQVARPGQHFDDELAAAIRRLLSVKIPDGPIEVVPKGANYAFKEPGLEILSPAEKHVIRMGPTNGRAFQDTLRRFAQVAGLRI